MKSGGGLSRMEGMGRVRGNLRMHQIFRRMSLWLLVSQEDGLGQNWVCMALPHGHGDLGRDKISGSIHQGTGGVVLVVSGDSFLR